MVPHTLKALILLLFGLAWPLAAYSTQATDALRALNLEKLKAMSSSDRASLDADLARALDFYYREDHARALPLFKQIANRLETMDLKFWIGTSAVETGDYALAKAKFEEMLTLDPKLYRVRLEYADLLEAMGDSKRARAELIAVRNASPPAGVIRNIDRRLAGTSATQAKSVWSADFSTGYQYDDNVTAGPDVDNIVIATGTLRLNANQQEKRGDLWLLKGRANHSYDVGNRGGLLWASGFDLFSSQNADYGDVNFAAANVRTGPVWTSGNYLLSVPVGVRWTYYGNQKLSDTAQLGLDWTVKAGDDWYWRATYNFAQEDYSRPVYAGNDNDLHSAAVGPGFAFDDGNQRFSAMLNYEKRTADSRVFSHRTLGVDLAWSMKLSDTTGIAAQYRRQERDYQAPAPLFNANREDSRDMIVLGVNYRFMERYCAAANYLWLRNHSNTDLYDYTKNAFSIEFGMKL